MTDRPTETAPALAIAPPDGNGGGTPSCQTVAHR